jgi:hypothetical protein
MVLMQEATHLCGCCPHAKVLYWKPCFSNFSIFSKHRFSITRLPRLLFGVPPGWFNQGKSSQPNRTGCLESIAQIACPTVVNCLRKINVISSYVLLFVLQCSVDTLCSCWLRLAIFVRVGSLSASAIHREDDPGVSNNTYIHLIITCIAIPGNKLLCLMSYSYSVPSPRDCSKIPA